MNKKFFYPDELHVPLILLDILKNAWLAILAAISVCIAIFSYKNLVYQPAYTAEATFVVSPRSNGSYVSFYSSMSTANEMAEVFREVFSSDVLKRLVREDLENPTLSFSVSCSVAQGTNILCVYAQADTPAQAHAVMQSVLENYREVSGYLFGGVVLDVLKNPQIPLTPSNPLPIQKWMLIGAFFAGAAVLCLIGMISVLRPTIKTAACAKRRMEETPLAILPREKRRISPFSRRTKKAPLITDPGISFQYTEALLQTTHKLRHKMQRNGHKVLLVSSAAENEGKSTVSANLALALATHGYKVALVDLDLRRPALFKIFRNYPQTELETCLREGIPASWHSATRLHLITTAHSHSHADKLLHEQALRNTLDALRQEMDYVILDSPPYTAVADSGMLLQLADCSLLVVRQDWVSASLCRDIAADMNEGHADYLGYLMNQYRSSNVANHTKNYYDKYGYYGNTHSED